jgi:hypothetical protein
MKYRLGWRVSLQWMPCAKWGIGRALYGGWLLRAGRLRFMVEWWRDEV